MTRLDFKVHGFSISAMKMHWVSLSRRRFGHPDHKRNCFWPTVSDVGWIPKFHSSFVMIGPWAVHSPCIGFSEGFSSTNS